MSEGNGRMPTYADLLYVRRRGMAQALRDATAEMEPGDIIPADRFSDSGSAGGVQAALSLTIRRINQERGTPGEFAVRRRDGRVYVVRLKPEHIPARENGA